MAEPGELVFGQKAAPGLSLLDRIEGERIAFSLPGLKCEGGDAFEDTHELFGRVDRKFFIYLQIGVEIADEIVIYGIDGNVLLFHFSRHKFFEAAVSEAEFVEGGLGDIDADEFLLFGDKVGEHTQQCGFLLVFA